LGIDAQNFLSKNDDNFLGSRIDNIRDHVFKVCESISHNTKRSNEHFEALSREIDDIRNVRPRFDNGIAYDPNTMDTHELKSNIERISQSQDDLRTMVRGLAAQSDKEAIKFCNLGFKSFHEASSWIDINFPDSSFGLVMSVFTVFEHINSNVSGVQSLERLNHLYKLKIDNMNLGLAITSFDQRWPKFFMKTQTSMTPITSEQSFFDRIPSHDVWDESQTGVRDRLKDELETFHQGYDRTIPNELEPGTNAYTIAYHSATASISFIEGLITFVDDIFKELHRAKFSKTKAWALVTRLMPRIFMDIGAPRVAVQNQFRTGQHDVICKHIFWAELQTLDLMQQFKYQGFKDHPAIASEYVKFLVTNTGIDSLDKLIKRVDGFEEQIRIYNVK
jgi:hypothetical protein